MKSTLQRPGPWMAAFVAALVLALSGAESATLVHLDFDDADAPRIYRSEGSGSLNLVEFDDTAQRRRMFTVSAQGQGRRPAILSESGRNSFVRFQSLASALSRDRSELILSRNIREGATYRLSFRLRLPATVADTRRALPRDDEWFLLAQVQQRQHAGSPPLSINLRRDPEGLFLDVVGRNDGDGFERLVTLPLDDSANFTFGQWNNIRLTFQMGRGGFAELAAGNGVARVQRVGARWHNLRFADGTQDYSLRMGLYRGGGQRGAFFLDMDDIVVSEL